MFRASGTATALTRWDWGLGSSCSGLGYGSTGLSVSLAVRSLGFGEFRGWRDVACVGLGDFYIQGAGFEGWEGGGRWLTYGSLSMSD